MAYQGPAYGLSRECMLKSRAKFDMNKALQVLEWIEKVTDLELIPPNPERGFEDYVDFCECLKDGIALCRLINRIMPGAVTKINKSASPFKQMENIEMFLKGCLNYGLKSWDMFQVNDLYEKKNPYLVVNCLFSLGGLAQRNGFDGPVIGVKVADENKRIFTKEQLEMGKTVLSLQTGTNRGASQAGMTPYGSTRQIIPDRR
ncbi:myophilin-like isoform X1 [Tachypleus tridentatus]|uniref:myophilin-like isoform X1 n=2 Tax=Tachypleus tridentatus TaxID=6853 RepID=UPI003FD68469